LNITVNLSINDDDIGLYVSKKLGTKPIKLSYPNIYILLHALIPMSVAGAERSFSVLQLIKTYLRNRTGDERLLLSTFTRILLKN
jgi:hypothetical protein